MHRAYVCIALAASSEFEPPRMDFAVHHRGDDYKQARARRSARKAVAAWVSSVCRRRSASNAPQRITQPPRNHCVWRRPG